MASIRLSGLDDFTFALSHSYGLKLYGRINPAIGFAIVVLVCSAQARVSHWRLSRYGFGLAERWIGSCRRDLLDHVLIFNEAHLRRLVKDYVSYYHTDRTHDGLEKDTPVTRPVAPKPAASAQLVSFPRMGGLHHRYDWQQAA